MKSKPIKSLPYRRHRQGKTNYRKRLKLLMGGKPRLIVRRSLSSYTIQLIDYSPTGDKVLASAVSTELRKFGWTMGTANIPAGYLTGYLLGKRAALKGAKEGLLDIGNAISVKRSRIYACLKGAIDSGMDIPCSEEVFPTEERIKGAHIVHYAQTLKAKSPEKHKKIFSGLIKKGLDPSDMPSQFDKAKDAINKSIKK